MSKTLIIVLVVVALVVLVGGGLAWAKHRGYCRAGGMEWIKGRISSRLNLDASQRQKLDLLGDALLGLRDQWQQTREQRRGELIALLETPSLDRTQAESLLETWHKSWSERGPELIAVFAEFSDSLSADQREKLRGLIEKRHGWYGHGWSH